MEDLKAGREGDRASAEMPAPPAREQAQEILAAVSAPVTLRPMPVVRQLSEDEMRRRNFRLLQTRALEQVLAEIAASERRCADLEEVAEMRERSEGAVRYRQTSRAVLMRRRGPRRRLRPGRRG